MTAGDVITCSILGLIERRYSWVRLSFFQTDPLPFHSIPILTVRYVYSPIY
jgi:hypothetical protein